MNAALIFPYSRWRLFLWRHPESLVMLLSAAAWLFLVAASAMSTMEMSPSLSAPLHAHSADGSVSFHPSMNIWGAEGWPAFLLHWAAMIVAMMFPSLASQLRVVAARSFWSRRTRATLLFLFGYLALWLLYGVIAEAFLQLAHQALPAASTFLVPFSLLIAAVWQLTRRKQKSLVSCHFTMPMSPSGWRADHDCCLYGARTAVQCCISCWALMLICAAASHALWAMLVVTTVFWIERLLRRPRQPWLASALFASALLAFCCL